jgi:tetratricopeptide (TPR) repeat protein
VRRVLAALLVAAPLAGGCAYYNGLFNANRLAKEARRAEREGRTSEARSLWSRAAVKAESVVARYDKSRYRDDALVLQGLALSRLGSCTAAIPPLRVAADSSPDRELRSQAHLLLGRCWLMLEIPDSALVALGPVADTAAPSRNEALLLRGQARLRLGDHEGALRDLTASQAPEGVFPRVIALTALERTAEAAALLESVVDSPYVESGWLVALDSLGAPAPAAAADLVDRLTATDRLGVGQRARLRLGDGERWARAGVPDRAVPRFDAVAEAAPDSTEGRVARARLAMGRVRQAGDVRAVAPELDSLRAATRAGGAPLQLSNRFVVVLARAQAALADSGTPLQLFVVAEDTRDSLAAPDLAAALFREVERRHPESVLTPKALLALALLRPEQADSLVAHLQSRYPESVYTLALRGEAGERYRVVEDSLNALGREQRRRGAGAVDRSVRQDP